MPSEGWNEAESGIINRAKKGDREAFGELVCHYRMGVINVVYRMCGDLGLSEDAAQDAFIKAWQHLAEFRTGTSFRNWLYRIAVNAAIDLLRKEKPAADLENLPGLASESRVETQAEQQERIEMVRRAVLALPQASRAVLILREYEGLSYQEISETLDIPTGTVMSRLNYARRKLFEQLSGMVEAG